MQALLAPPKVSDHQQDSAAICLTLTIATLPLALPLLVLPPSMLGTEKLVLLVILPYMATPVKQWITSMT